MYIEPKSSTHYTPSGQVITRGTALKKYEQIDMRQRLVLKIPDGPLEQIKYLCKEISRVEWSGVLFYSVTGTIADKSLEMTVEDILPMNKGTASYTAFDMDNRFVDYLMDNPQAIHWKVGLIHSHNTMGVFFSPTDIQELHDNADKHNFYLSLIVNNWGDLMAKVAVYSTGNVEEVQVSYTALDESGNLYVIDDAKKKLEKERLYIYDCEILTEVPRVTLANSFTKAVEVIMKPPVVHNNFKKDVDVRVGNNSNKSNKGGKNAKESSHTGLPKSIYENTFLKLIQADYIIGPDNPEYNGGDFRDKVDMVVEMLEIGEVTPRQNSEVLLDRLIEEYETLFPFSGVEPSDLIRNLNRLLEVVYDITTTEKYYVPFAALLKRTIDNLERDKENIVVTSVQKNHGLWTD